MKSSKNHSVGWKSMAMMVFMAAGAVAGPVLAGVVDTDGRLVGELQDQNDLCAKGSLVGQGGQQSQINQISPITIYSEGGFAPLSIDQPHQTFGLAAGVGKYDQGDGTVTHPFNGWSDFALIGNQRVSILWNFTSASPDQYHAWSISLLTNPSQRVVGMQWQNDVGASLGEIAVVPSAAGAVDVALSSLASMQIYRVSFSGVSLGMLDSDMQGVNFTSVAVPSAGPVALLAIAGLASKRRRA